MSILFLYIAENLLVLFFKGTLGAAEKLCVQLGCEVVETLVIIELVGLRGRERLASVEHFTTLFKFTDADFEELGANSDRVHQSNIA